MTFVPAGSGVRSVGRRLRRILRPAALRICAGTIPVKVEGGMPGTAPSSLALLPEEEENRAFGIEGRVMIMIAKVKVAVVVVVVAVSSVWAGAQPSTQPTQAVAAQTRPTGLPWLGIAVESIDAPERRQIAESLGYMGEAGLIVHRVYLDSPAAGIVRQGDILIEADGEKLTTAELLQNHVASAGVGGKLALTVFREKKIQKVEVTVGIASASVARVRQNVRWGPDGRRHPELETSPAALRSPAAVAGDLVLDRHTAAPSSSPSATTRAIGEPLTRPAYDGQKGR